MRDHRSLFRERLSWVAGSGIPIILAVAVVLGGAYLFRPRFVRPPVLLVDGAVYLAPARPATEPQEDLTYLGEVSGIVDGDRAPEKNFQANHDIAGASVYRRGDGNLAVLDDGLWYIYDARE
nr:hypothetical protein [uncultured Oscillibacter sp.]